MTKKRQSPRDAALTLAATVAVLGTSLGVAPQDILAAESTPAKDAAQVKLKPGADRQSGDPHVDQFKFKPGPASATMGKHAPAAATQHKEQMGANQGKFKPGADQGKIKPGAKSGATQLKIEPPATANQPKQ